MGALRCPRCACRRSLRAAPSKDPRVWDVRLHLFCVQLNPVFLVTKNLTPCIHFVATLQQEFQKTKKKEKGIRPTCKKKKHRGARCPFSCLVVQKRYPSKLGNLYVFSYHKDKYVLFTNGAFLEPKKRPGRTSLPEGASTWHFVFYSVHRRQRLRGFTFYTAAAHKKASPALERLSSGCNTSSSSVWGEAPPLKKNTHCQKLPRN